MKCSIFLMSLMAAAGFAFAQPDIPQEPATESPELASHGKEVSELAKSTPGGPEKGKIISSAACRKGLQGPGGSAHEGHGYENRNGGQRNHHSGKISSSPSPNSATGRGKPPGVGSVR